VPKWYKTRFVRHTRALLSQETYSYRHQVAQMHHVRAGTQLQSTLFTAEYGVCVSFHIVRWEVILKGDVGPRPLLPLPTSGTEDASANRPNAMQHILSHVYVH